MTHEPEFVWPDSWSVLHTGSTPEFLNRWAGTLPMQDYYRLRDYLDKVLRATYRNGFNDHARSRAYAEQVYGPYKAKTWGQVQGEAVVRQAEAITYFNQHGKGLENP